MPSTAACAYGILGGRLSKNPALAHYAADARAGDRRAVFVPLGIGVVMLVSGIGGSFLYRALTGATSPGPVSQSVLVILCWGGVFVMVFGVPIGLVIAAIVRKLGRV